MSMLNRIRKSTECVRRNIWHRFMASDFVMYDYVGLNDEIILPTPKECQENIPNALAWWTPIENGAFFNGVYLIGKCDSYLHQPDETLKDEISKLVLGLYKLQDVCNTPGVIARGIGSDGSCHYPASSNDQNIPWILGLWRYLATDIPTPTQRQECSQRLIRHIRAIQGASWIFPGETPEFNRGSLLYDEGLEGSLSSVHFAIITRILAELVPDEIQLHYNILNEKLSNGRTRLDIIAAGHNEFKHWHGWFTATSQYAVQQLLHYEENESIREKYLQRLRFTAHTAAETIKQYKLYALGQERQFTPDWRIMLQDWAPQSTSNQAAEVAMKEVKIWNNACPAIKEDKNTMMASLTAAWIVMMSMDDKLIEENLPDIINAISHFDYDNIFYAAMFYAENLGSQVIRYIQ
ncbi:MAG: hypothetical protein ACIAQZ_00440 [Sedimentisphaeraceae bacterium JB056]